MWEETGENPRIQMGDHHTHLHTTTVHLGDRTRVVVGISECIFKLFYINVHVICYSFNEFFKRIKEYSIPFPEAK